MVSDNFRKLRILAFYFGNVQFAGFSHVVFAGARLHIFTSFFRLNAQTLRLSNCRKKCDKEIIRILDIEVKNMKLRSKLVSLAAGAVLVTGFAGAAAAQTTDDGGKKEGQRYERRGGKDGFGKGMRGKGGMRGMRGGAMRGLRGIDLTDAQKEQIRGIMQANRPDESVREEMRTIMQARRDGTITEDQKQRAEQLRAQARQRAELVKTQVEAVLTPEQKQQIEQNRLERQQRMQERRQRWQQRREESLKKKEAGETKPVN